MQSKAKKRFLGLSTGLCGGLLDGPGLCQTGSWMQFYPLVRSPEAHPPVCQHSSSRTLAPLLSHQIPDTPDSCFCYEAECWSHPPLSHLQHLRSSSPQILSGPRALMFPYLLNQQLEPELRFFRHSKPCLARHRAQQPAFLPG